MEKQSELNLDAMQCKFDLAGKLWLQLNHTEWQEAAFVLQAQADDSAIKKALAKVKVVWVPTEQVTLMSQFVPGKRKQDWMTALPYSLEESLAEPVENLHFVALNRDSTGLASVAVISKVRMQQWVEQLQMMGLGHVQLVADCFQLPVYKYNTQGIQTRCDGCSCNEAICEQCAGMLMRNILNQITTIWEFSTEQRLEAITALEWWDKQLQQGHMHSTLVSKLEE